ncbi:class I poly(R)-hydroxyalkanoic acid synthase [Gammaproteobacteria bacterium]|nr:class I poly(R)-hydroxyalkanoic acid synthase [Gammaproteobacteria bacterium]
MTKTSDSNLQPLDYTKLIEDLSANFTRCQNIMTDFTDQYKNMDLDPLNLTDAYAQWLGESAKNPFHLIGAGLNYWQDSLKLYQQAVPSLVGVKSDPVIEPAQDDRRFGHDAWAENPLYDFVKQSYLLTAKLMRETVNNNGDLDEKLAKKVEFFTERYVEAMSPTNFVVTNPAVLEKTLETRGANLVMGLKNMLQDLESGNGQLRTRMTDEDAFELGVNVGATPGKVVFQNRMMQLIQYTPSTKKVFKRPLLVVPPWINKYYIMDLQPRNSLLKWLVDQGHTVFVISWVNPDETYRDTPFDDYLLAGPMAALDAIESATGENAVNAIGYCIGGTLLAMTLGYAAAHNDDRIKSATFLTSMLDFSDPGDLGIFVDEQQVSVLNEQMQEKGYLEGSSMATTFNLLRANDLIWSFFVNNYLLGNDPKPFDLLYWNSDSTRMPANMHNWYLNNLYIKNLLKEPGGVTLADTPIDLSKVETPVCFVSTVDDHIAPWLSTYAGTRLFSGPVKFILGGSGHIAGIINPPHNNKYGYRVTNKPPVDAEKWAGRAKIKRGSWWPEWARWVKRRAGAQVAARIPGNGELKVLEDAPGSYVKVRILDT